MLSRRTLHCTALATAALLAAPAALAQAAYPTKPITIVVGYPAGGSTDLTGRTLGEALSKQLGVPVVIDNVGGAGGTIGAQKVANAAPDGYTLLLASVSMMTVNPHTFSKLPYDPLKSFRQITGFYGSSQVMAVNASVPANNIKEFVEWARAQKRPVSFASFTAGNTSHFMGVILNKRTGLDLVHVPFNGTPPAVQNLVGQQVDAAFLPLIAVKPQVEAGKVKVLAVSTPERSPILPNVPTFREQGYPDLTIHIWSSLAAPAGTPDAVVNKLNAAFTKILREPALRAKWAELDGVPMPMTPDEMTKLIQSDSKLWGEAVRLSGFKASE